MYNAVISLKEKKKCFHHKIFVDESLNYVECGDCGEKLNPVWVLSRFANEENSVQWQQDRERIRLKLEREEFRNRKRTKCKHCGRMTEINIHISDSKIQQETWKLNDEKKSNKTMG